MSDQELLSCHMCRLFKPKDQFYTKGDRTRGRRYECKKCGAEYDRARYHQDPERKKRKMRAYNRLHSEHLTMVASKWNREHKDRRKEIQKDYDERNHEAIKAYKREWYRRNKWKLSHRGPTPSKRSS